MNKLTPKDYAYWLSDKIPACGDFGHEASTVLRRQAEEIESLKAQLAEANSNHESVVDEWKAAMREVERLQSAIAECRDKALEEAAARCEAEDVGFADRFECADEIRLLKGATP